MYQAETFRIYNFTLKLLRGTTETNISKAIKMFLENWVFVISYLGNCANVCLKNGIEVCGISGVVQSVELNEPRGWCFSSHSKTIGKTNCFVSNGDH